MAEQDGSDRSPRRFDSRQVSTVVAAILLAWFGISNWQRVEIHFWVVTAHAPLTIVIAVSAALGGFVVWLTRRRTSRSE
jgi:uncharacterized integral membrane protein